MTKREKIIERLVKINLQLCYDDCTLNDSMLYDLLVYGFKGFNYMTDIELATEVKRLRGD